MLTKGNQKVPHFIINMTSAQNCPAKKLGLCQLQNPNKCYAHKFEKMRRNVLDHHLYQEKIWQELSVKAIVEIIAMSLTTKSKKIDTRYIRFNVSGDFRSNEDITKLSEIAQELPNITFYGYTARKDLFTQDTLLTLPSNVTINGSGFMLHNQFVAVENIPVNSIECKGDCSTCNLCKVGRAMIIYNKMH